jgi:hypothetical protein
VLPLAGLLIASRPATLREWIWIAAAGVWLAVSLPQSGGLAIQIQQAWALFLTGAFVVLMLSGRRGVVGGALLATVAALAAATGWVWWVGTRWQDIQLAVAHTGWEARRELLNSPGLDATRQESIRVLMDQLADGIGTMARLYPAILVLTALPGLALAWAWYHRLASEPAGRPGGRFSGFRFSDQLIWLVVVCAAVFVLPVGEQVQSFVGNLALVTGGLYVARGAAVLWGSIEHFPLLLIVVACFGVVLILPVSLGACLALGLADTWVDFRRRFPPAGTEGRAPWK